MFASLSPQDDVLLQLKSDAQQMEQTHLSELMQMKEREQLILKWDELWVDFTRQDLTPEILNRLYQLADRLELKQKISALYAGEAINVTENRSVDHLNLRHPERRRTDEWKRLSSYAEQIRNDGRIRTVVNIGIGGSDLGPAMLSAALAPYIAPVAQGPELFFVGNVDPSHLYDILTRCNPAETLFIITSKTFTTAETMANASLAKDWLQRHHINPGDAMVGVTAAPEKAGQWGIADEMVFSFADGVGGRYSMWSAVSLSVMIGCGVEIFTQLLDGAYATDQHVLHQKWPDNLAVNCALIRIWQRQFRGRNSYGLMAYDQRLCRFAAWAQQLEMESNGKSVSLNGEQLTQPASPLIWGEPGTNAQHSFFQFLHQGVEVHPVDILVPRHPLAHGDAQGWQRSHRTLAINALAQAEALAQGRQDAASPHQQFSGNRPSVMISWDQSTAFALGRLLSLYEHITMISGFLWGINSFDQFGVELGKKLATDLEDPAQLSQFSKAAQQFMTAID